MSKYSSKIENFIYQELLNDFSESKIPTPSIKNSRSLSLISDAIRNTRESKSGENYRILSTQKLPAIHSRDQMPLIYLFFASLYESGLIDDLIRSEYETVPNLNDFWEFHLWYRSHAPNINYAKIAQIISKIPEGEHETVVDLYRLIYLIDGPRATLHKIYQNPFVSLDVQHDIESTDLILQKILINVEENDSGIQVELDLIQADPDVFENTKKPDLDLIAHILRAMHYLLNKSKFTDIGNLKLTIIMSAQKKLFSGVDFLAADNVNSGSTYPGTSVTIWRSEEIYKVLIHELIHYLGFDFGQSHPMYDELVTNLEKNNTIELEGPDAVNETYTEILATIINSIFYAYYSSNFAEIDEIQKLFESAINLERGFIIWQAAKIIKIYGGDSIEALLQNEIKLIQTTSVRSYYIFKMFVLFNLQNFVNFLDDGTQECGLNICDRLIEYGNLIIRSFEHFKTQKNILTKINENLLVLTNNLKKIEEDVDSLEYAVPWVYRTGRMSAIEIPT